MGRKKKREELSGDTAPLNAENPFAALAGMRSQLAEGVRDTPPERPEAEPDKTKRVVVRRQRKGHGGKTVTRVEGLGARADLVSRLKSELGTGARRDGEDVIVQGEQTDRVRVLLEREGFAVIVGS